MLRVPRMNRSEQIKCVNNLHRLVDSRPVQHLAVIVKIVNSRLPRQVLGLLRQIGGGSQSQRRGDQLSPAQKRFRFIA